MIWAMLIFTMMIASMASMQTSSRSPVLALAVILVIFSSGLRYKTGYDFDAYESIHYAIANGETLIGIEPGWIAFNTIALTFTSSPVGLFMLASLFIYGIIGWVLHKESKHAAVALLAFLLQLHFYWESLSILRQYMAIALSFLAAYNWISNRKVAFFFLCLLAMAFHAPAAIVLLTPVLTRWNSRWTFLLASAIGSTALNITLSEHLESISLLAKYQVYFDGTITAEGEVSSGLVGYTRLLIAAFIIYQIDKSTHINQTRKNLIANSLILGYALFFAFYESTALRRISYYFFIYEVLAIAYLVKFALQRAATQKKYLSAGIIGIYLVFGSLLMMKDVWTNPIGRQQDSQQNYEYRTVFE